MANNPQNELVWQGRIHIGDEPGVYGDAHFSGLAAELPLTVYRSDPSSPSNISFTLILRADHVTTFQGYNGHEIVVTKYVPDPTDPFRSIEQILIQTKLVSADNGKKKIVVQPGATAGPFFISVRLRVDTTVTAGLYNDFVWTSLSFSSEDFAYFASFGFDSP